MARSNLALVALSALALVGCKDSAPPAAPSTDTGSAPAPTASVAAPVASASAPTTTGAVASSAPAPASSGGDFFACTSDADCVAVPKNGCCDNGHLEAVNKTKTDAYKASFTCPNPKAMCPHYRVNDTRTPVCDPKTSQCTMVKK